MRPALRYHGGKWRVAPWIMSFFPPHGVYVEVFGGGASMLLRKSRARNEVYNDLDRNVVTFFKVLQDEEQLARLTRLVALTPFSRDVYDEARRCESDDPVTIAHALVIRSFQGWSSDSATRPGGQAGFRRFSADSNTAPAKDWVGIPDNLRLVAERFKGVVIENRPAQELLPTYSRPDTLIYADPPYVSDTRTSGRATYAHEMTDADHEALLEDLKDSQAMVIISGYENDLYRDLLHDWQVREFQTRAQRNGGGSNPRTELVWINGAAIDNGRQVALL